MKTIIKTVLASAGLCLSLSAAANPLATCMTASLQEGDKTKMVEWLYFSMSAHPDTADYADVTRAQRIKSDKSIGALVTRLLTQDCQEEFAAAAKQDITTVQRSFEYLGQMALEELMSNQDVVKAIAGYANHTDLSILSSAVNMNKPSIQPTSSGQ